MTTLWFSLAAVVSLATSWLFVTRLERIGEQLGLTEALLGMLAALAANTPEITSSITALAHHQRDVGAGVIIGSNVFNLAALLGLGAIVAGRIELHRKVVLLGGSVAMWIALVCVASVNGVTSPGLGLALSLVVFVPYVLLLATRGGGIGRVTPPRRARAWLRAAVLEEELELDEAIRPSRARPVDWLLAAVALVVVVLASVAMERTATTIGTNAQVPGLIIGGVLLAAVTSLPNAVAAVYLAAKGRGSAMLSTALNSNSLNVIAGLLVPALFFGIARTSGGSELVVWWYAGLTLVALGIAYVGRGLQRRDGVLIVALYAAFVALLFAIA